MRSNAYSFLSVETFLKTGPIDKHKKMEGAGLNYGTWFVLSASGDSTRLT